ncbi:MULTISPECIES: SIS domain-containing protein [Helcococcus]|uniref:SIS domain-containing protein n=1 Tax=Helcococcus bovis TaxID=3153252 RepID=A0ABW9F689_9FIRM
MFGLSKDEWKNLDGLYTASEIYQQPRLWNEVPKILEDRKEEIKSFLENVLSKQNLQIIFTGAGTSAYTGDFITPYLNKKSGHKFKSIATTDIVTNPEMYLDKNIPTLLVSFARSGNSPESVATVNLANKVVKEIYHLVITCNKDGKLAEYAKNDENALAIILPEESNDKGFAMTSSFSCMALTATLIFDNNYSKEELNKTVETASSMLNNIEEKLNPILNFDFNRIVYLGSGSYHGLSKEASLKLLELTRGKVVGYYESSLGFRHGPKSIIDDKTVVLVFQSNNEYALDYDKDILKEMYHDEGNHKVVSIGRNEDVREYTHFYLDVPVENLENDVFLGLLYVLYAQVFSLLASIKNGINPDNPNPSGAVNRVVKGVIIHEY